MQEWPFVLVIDDGELEDIVQILEAQGVQPTRMLGGPGPEGWRQPQRLLVVSGRRALSLGHPVRNESHRFTRIAVADSASGTLRSHLERMGFDHLVFRPVDPEALCTLIDSSIHTGRERRAKPRFAAGFEVSWRAALRRHRATLTEMSARGCRLRVHKRRIPQRLVLQLPGDVSGGSALQIPCQVVRCERDGSRIASVSVRFESVDPIARGRLKVLLGGLRTGPVRIAA